MTNAVLLMLLTGLVWTAVGVLFGAAPSERNRLYSFFATRNLVFCAFALATRPPSAEPASRRKRCRGACHSIPWPPRCTGPRSVPPGASGAFGRSGGAPFPTAS